MKQRMSPINGKRWRDLSFEERLIASYKINETTGCWEWINIGTQGYGGIDFEGKTIAAHRASFMHRNKINSTGELFVLHKCDNKSCVNPEHLYLGTKKQNRKDFMDRHPRAKEIMAIVSKKGSIGVKKFWESMTEKQKENFVKKRAFIQHGKRSTM